MNESHSRLHRAVLLMSLACTCAVEFVCSLVELVVAVPMELARPTTEDSLKEIYATGLANKAATNTVVKMPERRSRNSASRHVSMLKSLGGVPLAA